MKKGILITIIGIIIIGLGYFGLQMFDFAKGVKEDIEKSTNRNLVLVSNDYKIDLTDLDSVRENLNGFWIPEKNKNGEEILWLDFHKTKNYSYWETIPFNEEYEKTKSLPLQTCLEFAELININGKVQIQFVGLGGSDTTEIKYLSKSKFKLDETTFLRHKGYDFLKTWRNHDEKSD